MQIFINGPNQKFGCAAIISNTTFKEIDKNVESVACRICTLLQKALQSNGRLCKRSSFIPWSMVPFWGGCHLLTLSPWAWPSLLQKSILQAGTSLHLQQGGAVPPAMDAKPIEAPAETQQPQSSNMTQMWVWMGFVRRRCSVKQDKRVYLRAMSQSCHLSWLLPK